jgi:hypothetical protein
VQQECLVNQLNIIEQDITTIDGCECNHGAYRHERLSILKFPTYDDGWGYFNLPQLQHRIPVIFEICGRQLLDQRPKSTEETNFYLASTTRGVPKSNDQAKSFLKA